MQIIDRKNGCCKRNTKRPFLRHAAIDVGKEIKPKEIDVRQAASCKIHAKSQYSTKKGNAVPTLRDVG